MAIAISTKSLRRRARTIPLPRPIVDEVLSLFLKWRSHSGEEWTAARIKSIKTDMIQFVANGHKPSTEWLRKTKSGHWSGVWSWLANHARESRKGLRRVLTLLNVYSALVAAAVTRRQYEKFFQSVTQSRGEVPRSYHELLQAAVRGRQLKGLSWPESVLLTGRFRESHERRLLKEIWEFMQTSDGMEIATAHPMTVLRPLLGAWKSSSYDIWRTPSIGAIHVTQEPGYKARFFASPHKWLQVCLEPLKRGLLGLVKETPWDATFDQSKADQDILSALKAGRTTHCFDLSDATNVFPLELQLTVLRSLVPKQYDEFVTLFEAISGLPFDYEGEQVTWARGQALGLGPSFPIFTLTHGLLLYALNEFSWDTDFFVLGDDVIILRDDLAEKYSQALSDLDVPFSEHKTLRSSKLSEFAGKVYSSTGLFQIAKWRGLRDDNLLDIVATNGPEFISFLHPSIQPFVHWLSELPEPLGFGWNPSGVTLDARLEGLDHLWWPEKDPEGQYDMDPYRRALDRFRLAPPEIQREIRDLTWGIECHIADFDQKQREAFKRSLPEVLLPLMGNMGRNLRLVGGSGLPMVEPDRFRWKQPRPRFQVVKDLLWDKFVAQPESSGT